MDATLSVISQSIQKSNTTITNIGWSKTARDKTAKLQFISSFIATNHSVH